MKLLNKLFLYIYSSQSLCCFANKVRTPCGCFPTATKILFKISMPLRLDHVFLYIILLIFFLFFYIIVKLIKFFSIHNIEIDISLTTREKNPWKNLENKKKKNLQVIWISKAVYWQFYYFWHTRDKKFMLKWTNKRAEMKKKK